MYSAGRSPSDEARSSYASLPAAMESWSPSNVATYLVGLNSQYAEYTSAIVAEKADGKWLCEASDSSMTHPLRFPLTRGH